MARGLWPLVLCGIVLIPLSGCGWLEGARRPAWRAQAENLCLASGLVKPSAFIEPEPEINGPGICGMTHPFRVSALFDGKMPLDKAVTMDCSMIPALEAWLDQTVQPSAEARLGRRSRNSRCFGAYSCRSVDNLPGTQLSEHAFGNAVDVSGFRLADGREISIVRSWKRSETQESAFLREIHAGACQQFTTVLGPGSDTFHYNHFHLDLAMHGSTNTGPRRYCRPKPPESLMPPPARPDGLRPRPTSRSRWTSRTPRRLTARRASPPGRSTCTAPTPRSRRRSEIIRIARLRRCCPRIRTSIRRRPRRSRFRTTIERVSACDDVAREERAGASTSVSVVWRRPETIRRQGVFLMEPPVAVRPAATVILARDGDDGLEAFMVVRHRQIEFASGALVFPGGAVEPATSRSRPSRRRGDRARSMRRSSRCESPRRAKRSRKAGFCSPAPKARRIGSTALGSPRSSSGDAGARSPKCSPPSDSNSRWMR